MIHPLSELQQYLSYDAITGEFTWIKATYRRGKSGQLAGCKKREGYLTIRFRNHQYYAHNLAWYFMTGEYPSTKLDHKDGQRSNNVFSNLRPASDLENARNCATHSDNTLGIKGVRKSRKKFQVRIFVNGEQIHLGTFETPNEAALVYREAAQKYFGEFATTR